MGRVFDRLTPYYAHIGGDHVRDIGVYYSLESKIDFAANGKSVGDGEVSADAHTRKGATGLRDFSESLFSRPI